MIHYHPGRWSFAFAFSLQGSVFPKASVWAISCGIVTMVLHTLVHATNIYNKTHVKLDIDPKAVSMFGGFTFIFSLLMTIRAQQAYNRWWEGGSLLLQIRGEWFNAFSSLMAFCNCSDGMKQQVQTFQHKLARLMSLLFSSALHQVTSAEESMFEVIDLDGFDNESLRFLDQVHDRCEVVLQWVQRLIVEAEASQIIKVAPPILSRVHNQLGNGIVNVSNAKKITDFPLPFPLAQMLTLGLLLQFSAVAAICALGLEHIYWAGTVAFMLEMGFWGVNYISLELEMPFGDRPNDLPLHAMQRDFNKSIASLFHPRALQHPLYTMKSEALELRIASLSLRKGSLRKGVSLGSVNTMDQSKALGTVNQLRLDTVDLSLAGRKTTYEAGQLSSAAEEKPGNSATAHQSSVSVSVSAAPEESSFSEDAQLFITRRGDADSASQHSASFEAIGKANTAAVVSVPAQDSGLLHHFSGNTNSASLGIEFDRRFRMKREELTVNPGHGAVVMVASGQDGIDI